jgi:hypothetical protein
MSELALGETVEVCKFDHVGGDRADALRDLQLCRRWLKIRDGRSPAGQPSLAVKWPAFLRLQGLSDRAPRTVCHAAVWRAGRSVDVTAMGVHPAPAWRPSYTQLISTAAEYSNANRHQRP